ncbi:DoxX family protein [Microlunatus sp. GCM10028923]|uniref:DoxX family protein n=1 Tax=Microlunatus sp. GCM10028923 TaxID=3273400 RepID=UPI003607E7C2
MGSARDLGLLVLRLGIGGAVFAHGAQKLFGWFGGAGPEATAASMESMGFEPGDRNALLSGVGETVGGAMIAAGLGTGPAAAAVSSSMAVASTTHVDNGYFNSKGGFELPAAYAISATAIAMTGPGKFSLDHATRNVFNKKWMRRLAYLVTFGLAAYVISERQATLDSRSMDRARS